MIISIVFAPLFTLEGVEGKLFQPMVISIVLALFASLLVALMVMPALSSYVFKSGVEEKISPILQPTERGYRKFLKQPLQKKKTVVVSALGLFMATLALLLFLGTEICARARRRYIEHSSHACPIFQLRYFITCCTKIRASADDFPRGNLCNQSCWACGSGW